MNSSRSNSRGGWEGRRLPKIFVSAAVLEVAQRQKIYSIRSIPELEDTNNLTTM